jgi:hypothetical protein
MLGIRTIHREKNMSHKYTQIEIMSAKIEVLQGRLGQADHVSADKLYEEAIALLDSSDFGHSYDGDPDDIRTEILPYDE